jgi:hypothetical protein
MGDVGEALGRPWRRGKNVAARQPSAPGKILPAGSLARMACAAARECVCDRYRLAETGLFTGALGQQHQVMAEGFRTVAARFKTILKGRHQSESPIAEGGQNYRDSELPGELARSARNGSNAGNRASGEARSLRSRSPAGRAVDPLALGVRGLSSGLATFVGREHQQRLGRWVFGNAPILIFLVVYLFSSLLGALLLLAGYRPFVRLFEYFSGTHIPSLNESQTVVVLLLLCGAPLLLWAGYAVARRVPVRDQALKGAASWLRADLEPPDWLPPAIFAVSGTVAFVTLARAGALRDVSSWLNYGRFIDAREALFSRIGFMEFVNIYMFLPFSAALVMVTWRRGGAKALLVRWLPVLWVEFIDFLLFQKKTAIVSLLIIMLAALFFHLRKGIRRRRIALGGFVTVLAGLAIYFAAVVAPVYSRASGARVCLASTARCTRYDEAPALFAYATLSPITRSSAPVLYYPLVYPRLHPFYGPDLFQDEVGLPSHLADDNHDIWNAQYPYGPAGTSVAPFQFSIYAGSGLIGTLVECFIIGALMGLTWRLCNARSLSASWSSLLASSECIFGLYLAIDSWRNDTTVTYGALWAIFFIGMVMVMCGLFRNRAQRLRSWRGAAVFAVMLLLIVGVARRNYGKLPVYTAATERGPRWLAVGWYVVPGVTVQPHVDTITVVTTALPNGYALISPDVSLPPGSYVVTAKVQTEAGGLDLGVLSADNQRWITEYAEYGGRRGGVVREGFAVVRRTGVEVVLANYTKGSAHRSVWEVGEISLRSMPTGVPVRTWRTGFQLAGRTRAEAAKVNAGSR